MPSFGTDLGTTFLDSSSLGGHYINFFKKTLYFGHVAMNMNEIKIFQESMNLWKLQNLPSRKAFM